MSKVYMLDCPSCAGTGKAQRKSLAGQKCKTCQGSGHVFRKTPDSQESNQEKLKDSYELGYSRAMNDVVDLIINDEHEKIHALMDRYFEGGTTEQMRSCGFVKPEDIDKIKKVLEGTYHRDYNQAG